MGRLFPPGAALPTSNIGSRWKGVLPEQIPVVPQTNRGLKLLPYIGFEIPDNRVLMFAMDQIDQSDRSLVRPQTGEIPLAGPWISPRSPNQRATMDPTVM